MQVLITLGNYFDSLDSCGLADKGAAQLAKGKWPNLQYLGIGNWEMIQVETRSGWMHYHLHQQVEKPEGVKSLLLLRQNWRSYRSDFADSRLSTHTSNLHFL